MQIEPRHVPSCSKPKPRSVGGKVPVQTTASDHSEDVFFHRSTCVCTSALESLVHQTPWSKAKAGVKQSFLTSDLQRDQTSHCISSVGPCLTTGSDRGHGEETEASLDSSHERPNLPSTTSPSRLLHLDFPDRLGKCCARSQWSQKMRSGSRPLGPASQMGGLATVFVSIISHRCGWCVLVGPPAGLAMPCKTKEDAAQEMRCSPCAGEFLKKLII